MNYEIPEKMKAWVLGNPGELTLEEKPVPEPKRAEILIPCGCCCNLCNRFGDY